MTEENERSDPPAPPPRQRGLAIVLAALTISALSYTSFTQRWLYHDTARLEVREGEHAGAAHGSIAEVGIGLRSMFTCPQGGECVEESNSAMITRWRDQLLILRYVTGEPVQDDLEAAGGTELVDRAKAERALAMREKDNHVGRHTRWVIAKQVLVYSSAWTTLGWVTAGAIVLGGLMLLVAALFALARRQIAWPIMPSTIVLVSLGTAMITGCLFVALKPGPAGFVGVSFGFFAFGFGAILGLTAALLLDKLLRPDDPDLLEDAMNADQF